MNQEQMIKEVLEVVNIACKSAIAVYLNNVDSMSATEFKKAYSKMINSIQSHLESLFSFDGEMLAGLIKVSLNQISVESGNKKIYSN